MKTYQENRDREADSRFFDDFGAALGLVTLLGLLLLAAIVGKG